MPPPPKRHGCFFYGCVSLLVLGLVAVVLGVLLVLNAPKLLSRLATAYTETAPVQIQRVQMPAAELEALRQRLAAFQQALAQGAVHELALTDREINALLASEPGFKEFRDKLFVQIEGDTLRGQVSWPLDDLGPLKLKGRFLNGEAAFRLSFEGGQLAVFLQDIRVKGQPLPGLLLTQLRRQNLAEPHQKDPQLAAQLRNYESIKVDNGRLVLRTKAAP